MDSLPSLWGGDNFVLLTEDALIEIIGAKNLGAKRAQDLKDLHTGRFQCNLFGPNLGKSFKFIQDVDQLKDAKRFILTSSVRTNGLELQVLSLDASRHHLRAQTTKLDGKLVERRQLVLPFHLLKSVTFNKICHCAVRMAAIAHLPTSTSTTCGSSALTPGSAMPGVSVHASLVKRTVSGI